MKPLPSPAVHDDANRARSCTSKRRYYSEARARVFALAIADRDGPGAQPMRPCLCNFCGGWHLTSKVRRA